jgi:hypothetical protein
MSAPVFTGVHSFFIGVHLFFMYNKSVNAISDGFRVTHGNTSDQAREKATNVRGAKKSCMLSCLTAFQTQLSQKILHVLNCWFDLTKLLELLIFPWNASLRTASLVEKAEDCMIHLWQLLLGNKLKNILER